MANLYFKLKSPAAVKSRPHHFLQLSLVLQWESCLNYFLEVSVDIVVIILHFEVVRNLCPAHGAFRLVVEVASHALDAEPMTAGQDARLNHEVEAHAAVGLDFLGLLHVILHDKFLHLTADQLEFLIPLFFVGGIHVFNHCRHFCFLFLPKHGPVLVIRNGIRFAILIKEHHFRFDPVTCFDAFGFPLFETLVVNDLVEVLVDIFFFVAIFDLFFDGLFELLLKFLLPSIEKCASLLLVDLSLLPIKFPNKRAHIVEELLSLVNDLDILLGILVFQILVLWVHKLYREVLGFFIRYLVVFV